MVPRTMFPCGSRLVIMRQAVSRGDEGARGLKPARLLDARPKFPDRPELGDGQELVLVGGEAEEDEAARILEGHAVSLERAQISDGIGKREGKLLRLRSAGRVDWSPVADAEGTGETLRHKIGDEAGHLGRELAPRLGRDAARGHGAERIEAEADVDRSVAQAPSPSHSSRRALAACREGGPKSSSIGTPQSR